MIPNRFRTFVDFKSMRKSIELRKILAVHIMEQSLQYGLRCPATQESLNSYKSVLIKRHSPTPKCGETWVVVDGYAYDCAVQDGTLQKLIQESVYRTEVIDGRAL
jgi:hypothetical protein